MQNRDIINQVARRLRDVSQKEWKQDILLASLNSALQSVINVRPESNTVQRTITLVEGHEQRIDPDLHKLIHVLHNVNRFTGKAERAVTVADMGTLDDVFPDWRCDNPREFIEHYMLTDTDDTVFHVWPPAIPGRVGEEPVAVDKPVNPGPVDPFADVPEFDLYFIWDNISNEADILIERRAGDTGARASFDSLIPTGSYAKFYIQNGPPPEWWVNDNENLGGVRDVIEVHGAAAAAFDTNSGRIYGSNLPSASSMGVGPTGTGSGVYYGSSDPIFSEEGPWLIQNQTADKWHLEQTAYTSITQEEVDEYIANVSQYNAYVNAYNTYFAQEPGQQLRIEASLIPVVLEEDIDSDIPVGLHYVPALQEWMLYYCYAVDDEMTPNQARAENHFRHFFNLMEVKLKNSMRIHEIRTETD